MKKSQILMLRDLRVLIRSLNANHKHIFSEGEWGVLAVPGRWRGEDECRDLGVDGQTWMASWVWVEESFTERTWQWRGRGKSGLQAVHVGFERL